MRTRATRSSAALLAALGTAAAGTVLAMLTGLGQGISNASAGSTAHTVSSSVVIDAPESAAR